MIMFASIFNAQTVRPVRDSVGFCWNGAEMDRFVEFLQKESADKKFPSENLVAAISPHDDYLYAGRVYFPLYRLIKAKEIVIFGVTHGTVRRAMNDPKNVLILDDFGRWNGPYGNVKISPLREKIKSQLTERYLIIGNKAQKIEHSIEALIPFLQHYNRDIKITPIMVTAMDFDRMEKISGDLSQIIIDYMKENNLSAGKDVFFLISNDANHYGKDFNNSPFGLDSTAHEAATANDKRIVNEYLATEITDKDLKSLTGEIWNSPEKKDSIPLWCGRYPIVFGLLTTSKIVNALNGTNLVGKLFKYSDTKTEGVLPFKNTKMGLTAPVSYKHWVGFFSAGFYLAQ
ncbi:MAG: AmmeMemoRadiSam system protein B [Chlorobi bacterium]|nr:AmmeMemoRadiSam system protein B [Chlorobiota bacterium]